MADSAPIQVTVSITALTSFDLTPVPAEWNIGSINLSDGRQTQGTYPADPAAPESAFFSVTNTE